MADETTDHGAAGVAIPREEARAAAPKLGQYIPALDGLRGLAILLVMIFHFAYFLNLKAGKTWETPVDTILFILANTGWCGVDLFFVLSGFLITGILLGAKGSAGYLRNFYARRVLRIFPLYYGVLIILFGVIPWLRPIESEGVRRIYANQGWLWLFLSNIKIAMQGDPFFNSGWLSIGHFWSLAIEEQFYLVWPMLVLLLSRRALMSICVAIVAVAIATRTGFVIAGSSQYVRYVLTPCRMDSLAVGAFLAALARGPSGLDVVIPWARRTAVVCGGILAAWFLWRRGLGAADVGMQTVGFSVLAVFFGAVLTLAVRAPASDPLGRFLNNASLRFFGKYSYGLYVFHGLLGPFFERIVNATPLTDSLGSRLLGILVGIALPVTLSVAVALLSWHVYEKPVLRLKRYFEYRDKASGGQLDIAPSRWDAAATMRSPTLSGGR